MTQWKYYNHALVPDQPPHLPVDASEIKNGNLFDTNVGKKALFARWTEGWDLPQKTNFWYCIKDTSFHLEDANKKTRYELRKADKHFDSKRISPQEYVSEMYAVQNQAFADWPSKYRPVPETLEHFKEVVSRWPANRWVFGAFLKGTSDLVAYALVDVYKDYADFCVIRTTPFYEKLAVNAGLIQAILTELSPYFSLPFYINDGARNIFHQTNFQSYLKKYFGFREAYCKLHVKYRPGINAFIKIIYPFRRLFIHLDGVSKIHQLNAVLKMEEICRADKGVKCTD